MYSGYMLFIEYMFCTYFVHSLILCDIFTFLMVSFAAQKFKNLMISSLSMFYFDASAFGVTYKKSLLNPRSQRFTLLCSSKSFIV